MLGLIGGILGGLGSLAKIPFGLHQNSLANNIHPQYNPYQQSPYAKQQLGTAQQLFNGRMAGAGNLEQNIAGSQANYMANAQRNATDGSQLLALGGLAQGQANNAYQDLQTKEAQNKYNLLGNLNQAYGAMTQEGDKVYQDQLQKYQMDTQQKNQLRNSAWQNIFGGVGDLSSLGIQSQQLYGNNNGGNGSGILGNGNGATAMGSENMFG